MDIWRLLGSGREEAEEPVCLTFRAHILAPYQTF